jgi:cobalt-zinc-cadmium efflux system protein
VHAHAHGHAIRPLVWAFAITFFIFLVELAGGVWSGSLAHMAVDLAAMGIGLFAAWAAGRPADDKRTFGYHRVEVLAALANGVALWIIVGVILHEAWLRYNAPQDIRVVEMVAIAVVGLLANLISAALLFKHSHGNMNVRGVMLHVLSDALGSVGAIAAGVALWTMGWKGADPIASVFICAIISIASFKLIREAIHILLEGAPSHVDLGALRRELANIDGVVDVHDLHIWSLCSENVSMSGHLVVGSGHDEHSVRRAAQKTLSDAFGISHVTLQIEKKSGEVSK